MNARKASGAYWRLAAGWVSVRVHRERTLRLTAVCGLLVVMCLLALSTGSGKAGLADAVAYLSGKNGPGLTVMRDLRLPRIAMALACGAMLGLAGAALQTMTRNGLADPGLLGVREGASLAVVSLMLAFPYAPLQVLSLAGMAGGLCAALLTLAIARSVSQMRFILVGIGLSWFLSALLAMVLTAADIDKVQAAMVWMAGSLAGTQPPMLPVAFAGLAVGATVLFATARAADASLLGDAAAISLGVRIAALRAASLITPVLLTATAVSCAGGLGFVGLIAPHLARLVLGGGQSALLVGSALLGAALVLAADTIGRTLFAPLQIPAGIVLAIIGVSLLAVLVWRRRNDL